MTQLFDWLAHRFADSLERGWVLFCERMMAFPEERPALTKERKVNNAK